MMNNESFNQLNKKNVDFYIPAYNLDENSFRILFLFYTFLILFLI